MRLFSLRVVRRSLSLGGAALLVIVVGFAAKSNASAPIKTITTNLYTGWAGLTMAGAFDECVILNVSAVNHTISVGMGTPSGPVNFDLQNVVIGPGDYRALPSSGAGDWRCAFVVDGPASDVRAYMLLVGPDGSTTTYIPAY
jgi:hypothetical protein